MRLSFIRSGEDPEFRWRKGGTRTAVLGGQTRHPEFRPIPSETSSPTRNKDQ